MEEKKLTKEQVWENLETETDETLDAIKGQAILMKHPSFSELQPSKYNMMVFKLTDLQIKKRGLKKKVEYNLTAIKRASLQARKRGLEKEIKKVMKEEE